MIQLESEFKQKHYNEQIDYCYISQVETVQN